MRQLYDYGYISDGQSLYETFAQLVRNFCALTPLIPTFSLFYIKITIRNLLIINALYAMSFSSQLLHTRR
jgi:hypothetical protein